MSEVKQVIVFRHDLLKSLRKGKIAAQVAHASLGALLTMFNKEKCVDDYDNTDKYIHCYVNIQPNDILDKWLNGIFTKVCLYVENEEELLALYEKVKEAKLPCALITDAGNTEFHGVPTVTCLGIGPWWSKYLDEFTGDLKLF